MLSTHDLHLHGTRKLRDRFVGPFIVTQHVGETACRLDLSSRVAFHGVRNVFQVLLLCDWSDNGVHADVPPMEIDVEAEYEVLGIKRHREQNCQL